MGREQVNNPRTRFAIQCRTIKVNIRRIDVSNMNRNTLRQKKIIHFVLFGFTPFACCFSNRSMSETDKMQCPLDIFGIDGMNQGTRDENIPWIFLALTFSVSVF